MEQIGISLSESCIRCLDELESVQHLPCDYPAPQEGKVKILGQSMFRDVDYLRDALLILL